MTKATNMRLLHPMMPFLTEDIWSRLPGKEGSFIATAPFPRADDFPSDGARLDEIEALQTVITEARRIRADMELGRAIPMPFLCTDAAQAELLADQADRRAGEDEEQRVHRHQVPMADVLRVAERGGDHAQAGPGVAGGALDDAAATLDAPRKHVSSSAKGELKLIPVDEITFLRADHKYVAVGHDGGRDLISDSLKSLEAEFGDRFVRIHRGALVAIDRILRVDRNAAGQSRVVLRDDSQVGDEELIISRRHVAEVKRRLRKS